MSNSKEKKLDYVCLISENSRPFLNLTKIYARSKKHANPPPNAYNMICDWKKELSKNTRKGKWLKSERLTPAQETAERAKKAKLPGPGAYESNQKQKVLGAFNLTTEQMQMFGNQKWYSMQTPGAKYDTDCWVRIQI